MIQRRHIHKTGELEEEDTTGPSPYNANYSQDTHRLRGHMVLSMFQAVFRAWGSLVRLGSHELSHFS